MPASPGVKCGFGLSCWLAKSLLSARLLPCVYLCFQAPLFLDNLVVFLLSTAKCWRSEKPSGGTIKERGEKGNKTTLMHTHTQHIQDRMKEWNYEESYDATGSSCKTYKRSICFGRKHSHMQRSPWATGREGSPCLIFSLPVKFAESAKIHDTQVSSPAERISGRSSGLRSTSTNRSNQQSTVTPGDIPPCQHSAP